MLVCWGLRPVEVLRCWGLAARLMLLRCWGLAARWFVGAGTRVGGATEYAPPGATIGGECATAVRAFVTVIRARGPVWGAYAVAPRGFAAQGFALGYGPPGLQPDRVRAFRSPVRFAGVRRRLQTPTLLADGCRDRRRRRRAFRVSYRPRPASWDPSASRHRASSVPSVPWAAWDLWDPSAA